MTERLLKKIIIHCSDSEWGGKEEIDEWHKHRGFDEIGYHYVITNGNLKGTGSYDPLNDGLIQKGRDLAKEGAHCFGQNADSIGICLIGTTSFTGRQMFYALPELLTDMIQIYGLTYRDIYGHSDFNRDKTCPNWPMMQIKDHLKWGYIRTII